MAERFEAIIDPLMQMLSYCCGRNYQFEPKILLCYLKVHCVINKNVTYWECGKYAICNKCFAAVNDKYVVLTDNEQQKVIPKKSFVEKKNDLVKKEKFVECYNCKQEFHQICVLYETWKQKFLCDKCINLLIEEKPVNEFTSKALKQTKLGTHLENRINTFLKNNNCSSEITIRVVYQREKEVTVRKGARKWFVETGKWPEKFPYTAKTVLMFQEIDGCDVCLFAMFVQEYGSECPEPNKKRVYISYIDSIHYFQPSKLRTPVYHELILGYFDYVGQLGYTTAHLWLCPSHIGEDYIFNCHPKEQKIPGVRKLYKWYEVLLDKAINENIIINYMNIYTDTVENKSKVFEIPYFEGDFWPTRIETEISKLEEQEFPLSPEVATNVVNNKNSSNSKGRKGNIEDCFVNAENTLTEIILSIMAKKKQNFLTFRLRGTRQGTEKETPIVDPDPPIDSELMNNRVSFLEYAQENNYEFSTVRRAKFSTLNMLYVLHKNRLQPPSYYAFCEAISEGDAYHCSPYQDLNLCYDRSNEHRYVSNMNENEMELENQSQNVFRDSKDIAKMIMNLFNDHMSYCTTSTCDFPYCKDLRETLRQSTKQQDDLELLHTFVIKHSLTCKNSACKVPNCFAYKEKKKIMDFLSQKITFNFK